jgi:hypothetical protein
MLYILSKSRRVGLVNKIRHTILLIIFLGFGGLQGCSFLALKDCNILTFYNCSLENDEQIIDTGRFNYSYQEPRRKPLSNARVKSLRLGHPKSNILPLKKNNSLSSKQYFSANGNICRTIDAAGSEVACAVSGRWRESPPVLANSLPQ